MFFPNLTVHPWCVSTTQQWFQQYLRLPAGGWQSWTETCASIPRHMRSPPNDINDHNFCHDYNLTLVVSCKQISPDLFRYNITTTPLTHTGPLDSLRSAFFFCSVSTVPTGCGNHSIAFVHPFLVFMLRIHISLISGNPLEWQTISSAGNWWALPFWHTRFTLVYIHLELHMFLIFFWLFWISHHNVFLDPCISYPYHASCCFVNGKFSLPCTPLFSLLTVNHTYI